MGGSRRAFLASAAASAAAACGARSGGDPAGSVRIGYQKNGVLLVAKTRGALEARLRAAGFAGVKWVEFPSGPPLLEALAVDSIDFGATGDVPPIFSQVAGAPIVYVAQTRLSGRAGGLIVPAGSPVRGVADLRGRSFCFTRGSSAHAGAIQALERGGLRVDDVRPINLGPADAMAAFSRGRIDSWLIWDPYFTVAQRDFGARSILGLEALGGGRMFYLSSRRFADTRADALTALLDAMRVEGEWCQANTEEVARTVSRATGLEMTLMRDTQARADFGVEPLSDDQLAAQQATADLFARLNIIPKPVKVADAAWRGWTGAG